MQSYLEYNHKKKYQKLDEIDKIILTICPTWRIKDCTKKKALVDEVGEFGPILDLALRSVLLCLLGSLTLASVI